MQTEQTINWIDLTMGSNYKVIKFIKTGDWEPLSKHSSRINGDVYVGIIKNGKAKLTRYNKTGRKIHSIQRDINGKNRYCYSQYITELNISGDTCTSDFHKQAVLVSGCE